MKGLTFHHNLMSTHFIKLPSKQRGVGIIAAILMYQGFSEEIRYINPGDNFQVSFRENIVIYVKLSKSPYNIMARRQGKSSFHPFNCRLQRFTINFGELLSYPFHPAHFLRIQLEPQIRQIAQGSPTCWSHQSLVFRF